MRREQGNVGLILDADQAILKQTAGRCFRDQPGPARRPVPCACWKTCSQMLTFRGWWARSTTEAPAPRPEPGRGICYWVFNGGAIDYYGSFNAGQEALGAVSQNRVPRTASLNSPRRQLTTSKVSAIAGLFNGSRDVESASPRKGELQRLRRSRSAARNRATGATSSTRSADSWALHSRTVNTLRYASQMEARYLSDQKTESSSNSKAAAPPALRSREARWHEGLPWRRRCHPGQDARDIRVRRSRSAIPLPSKQRQDHLNYGYDS